MYADVLADPDYEVEGRGIGGGYRSLSRRADVPRRARSSGRSSSARKTPRLFTDSQVELLKTFADQAVIAVENVRLFKELDARTTQLTRSVGELKALGEIGQAVSSTLDLATVLSTIVSRATQLAGMDGGAIYEYDEAREDSICTRRTGCPTSSSTRSAPLPFERERVRSGSWR